MTCDAYILAAYQHADVYEKIKEWINNNPSSASFSRNQTVSYVNHKTYYQKITFETEEDLLAFSLIFSNYIL